MFRENFLCNFHCCSYYDQASLLLKYLDESYKEALYSLSGDCFLDKVKLDYSNPFGNQFCFRIFGFGSINGILCLHDYDNYGPIVLWNPTNQEIKPIPPSPVESVSLCIPDVFKDYVNVFSPYYLHGFGHDSVIDDIRKLDIDMPSSLHCMVGTQLYMNGVCHWLCEENSPSGLCLLSFYLSNEAFFITPIPSDEDDCFKFKASWINLVVLNGYISLITFHEVTNNFHIAILDKFGVKGSWTKLFIIGPFSFIERPIGVGTKGEIFFQRKDRELVLFDLSTQMIEELGYKARDISTQIIIYKEIIHAMEE
ncbi:F-box protein interaction domain protein [Medicago truncatula]|uniref:F-box protein interaction domain protein n=1 Tax=Medicago truncatula TaxID=3880 RepID=G7KVS2_MEDTR|nr:F-box protein interaction domain protein [Medicago truncatula]